MLGRKGRRSISSVLALSLFLAACGDDDNTSDGLSLPELDLSTLEVETEFGLIEADPLENAFVGAVDDDTFIGVSLTDTGDDGAREATAYLCNGDDVSVWLTGETVDETVPLQLGSFEDGAYVELQLANADELVGTAQIVGHGTSFFTAERATGEAGLYRGAAVTDEGDVTAGWVVLEDGQQRGNWHLCYHNCIAGGGLPQGCVLACAHLQ